MSEEAPKSKRERFEELAPKRVEAVLAKLAVLGNCGNRAGYEYGQREISDMFHAIRTAVDESEEKFRPPAKERTGYTLPSHNPDEPF